MTIKIMELFTKGLETYRRFPLALFSSLMVTVIAIYFVASESREIKGSTLILEKLATTAMLGVFVFTALRLLSDRISRRTHIFILLLAFGGLVGYYTSLPNQTEGFSTLIYIYRHIWLLLLFCITILWVPFVHVNISNVDYWEYVKNVILNILMTLNFTVVIVLGVTAALSAVDVLFGLSIKSKYFIILDIFIVGVFFVAYFLSQIPSNVLNIKASIPPPRVEKFFTLYVLTPLTGLYFIILYAYTAKILVSEDWPTGLLAWLIIAFSVMGIFTYLFWTHFTAEQRSKWQRWIWLAVFVQTLVLFVDIGIRIAEYSWTENRYMVLILGVWLAGISLYFLVIKEAKIKWIFVSLSLLLSLSQVGPFSAYNVSKKAQLKRLESLLSEYRQFRPEELKEKVSGRVRYGISEMTEYLYTHYGLSGLGPVIPKITSEFRILDEKYKEAQKMLHMKLEKASSGKMVTPVDTIDKYKKIDTIFQGKPQRFPLFVTHELGFNFLYAWSGNSEYKYPKSNTYLQVGFNGIQALDIHSYDYMGDYYGDSYAREKKYFENIGVTVTFDDDVLTIQKEEKKIIIDVYTYIKDMIEKYGNRAPHLTQQNLMIEKENEKLKIKIEFRYLQKNDSNSNERIKFSARILFKLKGEER